MAPGKPRRRLRRRAAATVAAVAASLIAVPIASAGPAYALDNGLALTPPMGFNDWNAFGCNVDEQLIKQTADFFVSSGLKDAGYEYVNIDDCWLTHQRDPVTDRLVPDPHKFPDGIKGTADYVHSLGLKLGIYEDAGAYTCAGYPGSLGHEQLDAQTFADWGVDYLKYDNCSSHGSYPDTQAGYQARYEAMRDALAATGRPIVFSLCEWGNFNPATWAGNVGNLWRTTGDINDSYSRMVSIFHQNVGLYAAAHPGAWNDPDMLEVGNGGMTNTEYKSHFSLWAEMAAPLLAGTDFRKATPATMAIYLNKDVIAVDQDPLGKQAVPVSSSDGHWVLSKPLANGDRAVLLFNETGDPATISTTASAVGFGSATAYTLKDLWSKNVTETAGTISAYVPAHGTVMYRVSPTDNASYSAPDVSVSVGGLSSLIAGQHNTATVSFTDNGVLPAQQVTLGLDAPSGWTVTPTSATSFGAVESGQTVQSTYDVVAPVPDQLFQPNDVTATADYGWHGKYPMHATATETVTTSPPVQAPYQTFSSATDAPARFAQSGSEFGISGAGSDIWEGHDNYSTIYLPGAVGSTATIETEVASQSNLSGFGKAGIIVRNDVTASGTSPEGVILFESPEGGIEMEWAHDGGTYIDSVTPHDGDIPQTTPVHLRLERTSADTYTGYYGYDGEAWYRVDTVTLPNQAATQDAGMFVTSHATGSPASVVFDGFDVTAGATPTAVGTSYEAESAANTIASGARLAGCSACSGDEKVGYVGSGGTLTFNGVTVPTSGTYDVTFAYLTGNTRPAQISVDGGPAISLDFAPTGGFSTVGTVNIPLQLKAGANTIEIGDPGDYSPDFDRILVPAAPMS